ncbi:MAG TPA: LuxR C-terminal-related transcriptional regulator [Phycisphaerae bacterium]|nr:LuxR C-terminal-related transcriptional regulator [Phycisphaerae bacterium]
MSFADETRIFETSQPLGRELTLQIRVDAGPGGSLSNEKKETLRHAIRLIHAALERIFVQVKDPQQLGQAFQRLSGREWEVCLALESPHGEKEIAETLGCTRHTVHSYVKNLYRKLGVQSRMEVLTQLRQARDLARSGLVDQFVAIGENRTTTPASENVCGTMRDAG